MALWRPRVRVPSGPLKSSAINQSGTAEDPFSSLSEEGSFLFSLSGMQVMENLFLETEFGNVFAKSAGERGKLLVLGIHGWSQRNGWHTWKPLMAPLAEAGFWVVSVDMPGWGQSVPASPEPLRGERAVTAVLAILDVLKEKSESGGAHEAAVLMGKSWGGGVAISLALDHPQHVSKLILTAPAFRKFDRLRHLSQPVLLAWAEDDPVIPYKYARRFTAAVPHIRLQTYATGGHSAAPKNATHFAPQAIEFLKQKT